MMVSECFLVEGLVRFINFEALFERLIVAERTGLLDFMLGLLLNCTSEVIIKLTIKWRVFTVYYVIIHICVIVTEL